MKLKDIVDVLDDCLELISSEQAQKSIDYEGERYYGEKEKMLKKYGNAIVDYITIDPTDGDEHLCVYYKWEEDK